MSARWRAELASERSNEEGAAEGGSICGGRR
jgi:hypothetical protein